jgi:spermidine synthase
MTSRLPVSPAPSTVSPRFLPLLVLLFVGSGCAALIYEIVWFQLLSLIIGSSAVSLGVLLVVFMGGMCLGSLLFAHVVPVREHPLRMYAMLELGIAVFGILVLYGLPYAGGLYTAIGGPGFSGLLLRAIFCIICLLPPTLLMGATLPAIARWVEATPKGVSWLGFFYGGNIAGAVFGCLLAGFYLLRVHDMAVATYVAMALNIVVALAGLALARATVHEPPATAPTAEENAIPRDAWPVYATIALSGMTALGAEVIWTRLLSLMLGATVYTFSLILGVFLFGLGIGSSAGAGMARSIVSPRRALGWCQFLVMASLAWAAWSISRVLPYWPIHPGLATAPRFLFEMDLLRSLWVVLPGAVLWGASFPLALAAVASKRQDPARLVGTVYAANTVGAILGAATASLVLVSWFGTQNAQRILIAVAAVSATIMLAPVFSTETGRFRLEARSALRIGATVAVAALLMWSVTPIPPLLIAYGRWMVTWIGNHGEILYTGEGMNSSMAVSRLANGDLNYHNAGKVQASSEPQDMRLQRMLGHLTTLIPANPANVLVIGCGAGVTAGAVSINPMVQRVTIAEIEPLVPEFVAEHFGEHNYNVVRNPKVKVQIDDARHFLLTSDDMYDAITSDPFDPWVKGAATLYTKEFFQVAKRHLKPGGVITVFVQLYESGMPAVKSEVATFLEVFPNGIIWGNTHQGGGYDVVLMGQADPRPINVDTMEARLARPEFAEVAQSLREIGFNSATDLLSTYAGDGPHLQPWLADAQVNTDRNLRLQYLAGLGVNKYEQREIYSAILSYRQPPEGLFVGSPERLAALRMGIMGYP